MRVLCVDDDRINALLLEQVCRDVGGLEVECVETGADAMVVAARWQPELLVIDLHLPDTDGLSLLPRLRSAAGRTDLPAVLCTAELLADARPRAQAAGFDDCWPKPVMIDDLRTALQRLAANGA
jgi:two-component system OmpR family response regulator